MRLEYVAVSIIIALIVILLAVSILTGAVPGVELIIDMLRKAM